MENFKKEVNKSIVYLDNFIRMLDKYHREIIFFLEENGYQNLFCKEFDYSYFMYGKKFVLKNDFNIITYAIFDNEIKAKSQILFEFGQAERIINHLTSLYVLQGYDGFFDDENHFLMGIIGKDGTFYPCLSAEIKKYEEQYITIISYKKNIIDAVKSYFDDFNMMNLNISPFYFGLVLLHLEKPKVNETGINLIEKYHKRNVFATDNLLSAHQKYEQCETNGASFIVEINYRYLINNIVRIKNVLTQELTECSIQDIDSTIKELNENNSKLIYQKSLEIFFSFNNSESEVGKKYICFNKNHLDYFNTLEYFIIRPFNQRVRNKKCSYCDQMASKEILIFRKEK